MTTKSSKLAGDMNHKTLLRDLPEFSERIENSRSINQDIEDCLTGLEIDENSFGEDFKTDFVDKVMKVLSGAEYRLNGNEIEIGNRNDLALEIFDELIDVAQDGYMKVTNGEAISVSIKQKVTEFVNENYTQK